MTSRARPPELAFLAHLPDVLWLTSQKAGSDGTNKAPAGGGVIKARARLLVCLARAWYRFLPWKLEQGCSNSWGGRPTRARREQIRKPSTNRQSAPVPGRRRRAGFQYKSHTGRAELGRANRVLGSGMNDTSNVTSLNKRGHLLRRCKCRTPHSMPLCMAGCVGFAH